jgi:hypothetical protein
MPPGTEDEEGNRHEKADLALSALCHYPTVDITDEEVHIGEEGNRVKLTPAEWNILVQAIQAGELTEL